MESDEGVDDTILENSGTTTTHLKKSTLEDLQSQCSSDGILHGSNLRESKRDAFMEAPPPVVENPLTRAINTVCQTLTNSFIGKAERAVSHFHGSGMTPILGESQCSSRDEPFIEKDILAGNAQPMLMMPHTNQLLTAQALAAEVEKLAALTDSYFIESDSEASYIEYPEPKVECPPPPVPERKPTATDVSQAANLGVEIEIAKKIDKGNSTTKSSLRSLALSVDLPSDFSKTPSKTKTVSYEASATNFVIPTPVSSGLTTGIRISEEKDSRKSGIPSIVFDKMDLIDFRMSSTCIATNPRDSNNQLDSNCNTILQRESSMPQISEFMLKLKPFWPNKVFSTILTPEAQLQFAMNKFFDATGTKSQIEMSVARFENLNMSTESENHKPEKIKNQIQMTDETELQADMSHLEMIIQELFTEIKSKNITSSANATSSLQKPQAEDIVVQVVEKCDEPVFNNPKTTDVAVSVSDNQDDHIHDIKQYSTKTSLTNPQNVVEVGMNEDKIPEIKFNDSQIISTKGKLGVSARLTKIPSRFFTVPRLPRENKKEAVHTMAASSKSVSKNRNVNLAVAPPPSMRYIPKIKIIDTIPFTQPTKSRVERGVPNTPVCLNALVPRTAVGGSYSRRQSQAYTTQQPTSISSRENSRTSLCRTNSYRHMHQMKQFVSGGGPQIPSAQSLSQNPRLTSSPSSKPEEVGSPSYITRMSMSIGKIISPTPTDELATFTASNNETVSTLSTSKQSRSTPKRPFFPF